MDYKKDLLKEIKKSKFRVLLGIAFFIISILGIALRVYDNETIKPLDWFYVAFFSLYGIVHVLGGTGFSVERLFGKAYIEIDSEFIRIKPGAFEKEQKAAWQDIKSIDYKPINFKIQKRDNSTQTIKILNLSYSDILEVKKVIAKMAGDKGVIYTTA